MFFTLQGNFLLDNYVSVYYNIVTKGVVKMDFLDRLRMIMKAHGDNNSTLSNKSGIPYTTIVGLFNRGWEKAQTSTISKICEFYGVSLDYMVYGAKGLSDEAIIFAGKYDNLDPTGKEMMDSALVFASKHFSK